MSIETGKHTGGQNPPCAHSEPHHPNSSRKRRLKCELSTLLLTTEFANWYLEATSMLTPPLAQRIKLWPIDQLIPYARNARTHSDAQVAQIAASITEFGFNNPILVDTKAGIIAGHGRLLAARKLKLTEVPVIVLDHLTETQKRAYVIADNQLALNAGWDADLLRLELVALQEENFDVSLIG